MQLNQPQGARSHNMKVGIEVWLLRNSSKEKITAGIAFELDT